MKFEEFHELEQSKTCTLSDILKKYLDVETDDVLTTIIEDYPEQLTRWSEDTAMTEDSLFNMLEHNINKHVLFKVLNENPNNGYIDCIIYLNNDILFLDFLIED